VQDSGKVIIYILIGLPVEVLSESCVGNAGGVVAEQVHSWVDDAHRYHLPAARQNYIVVQKTKNKCSFKCNFVECAQMRSILRDLAWSVCLCVCLLVTTVSCAKTAQPIEMPFGMWTRRGSTNDRLGATGSSHGKGPFGVIFAHTCQRSIFSTLSTLSA